VTLHGGNDLGLTRSLRESQGVIEGEDPEQIPMDTRIRLQELTPRVPRSPAPSAISSIGGRSKSIQCVQVPPATSASSIIKVREIVPGGRS